MMTFDFTSLLPRYETADNAITSDLRGKTYGALGIRDGGEGE